MASKNEPADFDDLMREYEDEMAAKAKLELAAEKAAWDALPQAEKDRIIAEREARLAAAAAAPEEEEEEEEDDDDEYNGDADEDSEP
jgi:tagatose-1,6-bisphosphate aldolase non-catalytic subunit AgaZ/GatZ